MIKVQYMKQSDIIKQFNMIRQFDYYILPQFKQLVIKTNKQQEQARKSISSEVHKQKTKEKPNKYPQHKQSVMQIQPSQSQLQVFQILIGQMVCCLNDTKQAQYYIPQQKQMLKLKNNMIGNTFIIYGPTQSGKTSSVYWANEQQDVDVVLINCDVHNTESQFVQALKNGILKHLKHHNDEGLIDCKLQDQINNYQNIRFDAFNQVIIGSGRKFVFAIKKCQKIAEMKKPTLFYNLLQWVNGPIKSHVGLVFISRAFHFTDRLEKRVKSRLSAKSITLMRPQGAKIIQIYKKRFNYLLNIYQNTLSKKKKQHRLIQQETLLKRKWLKKFLLFFQDSKCLKQLICSQLGSISNQFLNLMKGCICNHLQLPLLLLPQIKFNKQFMSHLLQSKQHIGPNYNLNLLKELPPYCVLLVAVIGYMGLNNRAPYRLSNLYDVYKELMTNQHKFMGLKSLGCSKKLFQNAFDQLLDSRIIQLEKYDKSNVDKEIILSAPPEDLCQIIQEIQNIPGIIKQIVKM